MLAEDMRDFRQRLAREGVVFCYSGYLTENILTSIGAAVKTKLSVETSDKRTVRGLFSLLVEQVQNVIRYSAETEIISDQEDEGQDLRYGTLTVGKRDGQYFVACSNLVQRADVSRLRDNLERLRGLDADALKALYKETLRGDAPAGSKGAGAGFIEVARRAASGFDFDFCEADDTRAYFAIRAYI